MKNNYNPYSVPENFFENTNEKVISKYKKNGYLLRHGFATLTIIAVLIITPIVFHSLSNRFHKEEVVVNTLANMYEYDIFLQVNF